MSDSSLNIATLEASDARRPHAPALAAVAGFLLALPLAVGRFLHAVWTVPEELRRMADECEATRPEQAKALRKAAAECFSAGW